MTQPIPDAEQVGVAWAKTLDLPVGTAVATTLPEFSSWPTVTGGSKAFLQVYGTGGGTVGDTPLRRSVLSFDAWAAKTGSDRPPLALATAILATVMRESYHGGDLPKSVTLPNGSAATVHDVRPINDHPRRIPDQDTSRAHFSVDIEIMWTED